MQRRTPRATDVRSPCAHGGFGLIVAVAAASLGVSACEKKLDGPKPRLAERSASTLPVDPAVVCNEQLTTIVTLHGKRFSPLAIDVPNDARVELPTVTLTRAATLDGDPDAEAVEVVYGGDPKLGENASLLAWQSNEQMQFTVNQTIELAGERGPLPVGIYDVRVRNANKHEDQVLGALVVAPPPRITVVDPAVVCRDAESSLRIQGRGFLEINGEKPTVRLGGVAVPAQTLRGCQDVAIEGTSVKTCTSIVVEVDGTALPGGDLEVEVTNPASAGCKDSAKGVLTVLDADPPIVFFVDPPVAWNGMLLTATIFTSGLTATAASVELVHEDTTTRQDITDFESPDRPNKILAELPKGLKPGSWDVIVTNSLGCGGRLEDGLTVTDTLDDALLVGVSPAFASPTQDTALTLTGSGFSAVPRVYITPAGGAGAPLSLRAVELKASDTLTAVVPAALTPGSYDLVVVNPDGKVDVLEAGLTITVDEPPVVVGSIPASLPANADGELLTITGTGIKPGLDVELECLTTGGDRTIVPTTAGTPSGDGTSVTVTVTMADGSPTAPDAGSICLVRLTNSDGAFFEFSAFSITNSSLNLSPWTSGTNMTLARRAPAAAAGRPTATSRYVFALGGDEGAADATQLGATVYASVESASVDVFGEMGAWALQRNSLPEPRTWAGAAAIGRFVYLVGGHDGTSATSTLFRAQILDPLTGPEIRDVNAELSDGSAGLGGGLYYYRVAALYPSNDLNNPGGESLPGELLPVQLPEREEKILLTLFWPTVEGAHGYRVYRSKTADAPANQLELVGEVTCGAGDTLCDCDSDPEQCQLGDDGGATMAGVTHLPEGSLGVWHSVEGARCTSGDCQLGTEREALAVASVKDPADPGRYYLYAFGGRDAGGAYLDSYEFATVTVATDGTQTISDFAPGSDTLAVPRAEFGVWIMRSENAPTITTDDVWVYLGGGRTTGGAFDRTLEAGLLAADGDLGTFSPTDGLNNDLAGFGAGSANNQLFTFGGTGSSNGTSASLCDGKGSCNPLPDLQAGAFNSLGAAATDRQYMGAAQESAFFFLVGGHDGDNTLATTQQTVQ